LKSFALLLVDASQVNVSVGMQQQQMQEEKEIYSDMIKACVSALDGLKNERSEAINMAKQLDHSVAGDGCCGCDGDNKDSHVPFV
jgi:hypothetical protein